MNSQTQEHLPSFQRGWHVGLMGLCLELRQSWLMAEAIPYEKQPMYTFYDKAVEEVAKEPIIRLPEEKRKITMTASFHLTRHPASGTDVLKGPWCSQSDTACAGKVEPAGGVKAYSAESAPENHKCHKQCEPTRTWLDKDHLGMKDPTLRPGDADLEELMKKKPSKVDPFGEQEEEEEVATPVAQTRPTSAASAASGSIASDASSSKKKKVKKKKSTSGPPFTFAALLSRESRESGSAEHQDVEAPATCRRGMRPGIGVGIGINLSIS